MNNQNDILVSICSITYNQAPYIRQCLDGFLMQETNFKFEIIIHDDCSTDGTTDIVREYAEKYPDVIVPIIQSVNQYQNGNKRILATFVYPKVRGRYIAICEGDDYWTDSFKLQKQVDILNMHPQCTLVVSNGLGYYENKKKFVQLNPIPTKESKFLTMHEVLEEKGGLIPTASMCFRRQMAETEPEWCLNAPVGDRPLRMWCALNGKVYYDIRPMVVYRKNSIGSFTQRVTNYDYARHILDDMNVFFDSFDAYTKGEFFNDVQYMKDREEYYFYCRIGDDESRNSSAYFRNLPLHTRTKIKMKTFLMRHIPKVFNLLSKTSS